MAEYEQLAFNWAIDPRVTSPTPERHDIAVLLREFEGLCAPPSTVPNCSLSVAVPLREAIEEGHFGSDEHGPIRPSPADILALTEQLADLLINLIEGFRQVESWVGDPQCSDCARLYHERDAILLKYRRVLTRYGRDFGSEAAEQLDAYARHNACSSVTSRDNAATP